jgi:hypothetical protein
MGELPDASITPVATKRPPMLAWWGGLSVVVFAVVHVRYGWPKARLLEPQYPAAFFCGQLLAGPLLALAVAWVVYRISGRWRFSATFVFSVVMVLAALATWAPRTPAQNPRVMSFGDFQFEAPVNWRRASPQRPEQVAYLVFASDAKAEPSAVLIVTSGPAPNGTTRRSVASLGPDFAPAKVSVDGEQGERIRIPNPVLPRHQLMVAVEHGGKYYIIMVSGLLETDIAGPLDQVLTTWKWSQTP